MKKFLKINCTNSVPLGVPICLPVFLVNYKLVPIIRSETELEISGHVVQRFWSNKKVLKRKGHEMHSGYLESRTGFEVKNRHCLSTGLRFASKSKIKLKDKVKV